MNKRKILALVTAMAMLIGVNVPAMAAEEVTPYVIGNSRTAISTTENGSLMLNCNTSLNQVPDNTEVNIWTNTGNNSQRWRRVKSAYGVYVLEPYGSPGISLNCQRGSESKCNVIRESRNADTKQDMAINFTYIDKNKPSFRMWVSSRPGYNAAYVTRRGSISGSACDWKYAAPGSTWFYRAG